MSNRIWPLLLDVSMPYVLTLQHQHLSKFTLPKNRRTSQIRATLLTASTLKDLENFARSCLLHSLLETTSNLRFLGISCNKGRLTTWERLYIIYDFYKLHVFKMKILRVFPLYISVFLGFSLIYRITLSLCYHAVFRLKAVCVFHRNTICCLASYYYGTNLVITMFFFVIFLLVF